MWENGVRANPLIREPRGYSELFMQRFFEDSAGVLHFPVLSSRMVQTYLHLLETKWTILFIASVAERITDYVVIINLFGGRA